MAIREGRWDCPSCGSTGIQGRHLTCPGCKTSRPAGVRFYLPYAEPEVQDHRRLAEAGAGADWICRECGASNRAKTYICDGCGGEKRGSRHRQVTEYRPENTPRPPAPRKEKAKRAWSLRSLLSSAGSAGAGASAGSAASRGPEGSAGSAGPGGAGGAGDSAEAQLSLLKTERAGTRGPGRALPRRGAILAGAGALAFAIFASLAWSGALLRAEVEPATVEVAAWSRWIYVETRSLEPGEGWELPDSAVDVVRSERVRGERQEVDGYRSVTRYLPRTERVVQGYRSETRTVPHREQTGTRMEVCGTRDLGNGYFEDVECERPVYTITRRQETVSVPVYAEVARIDTVADRQPVYRTVPVTSAYFTYRVPRWTETDTLHASGTWMNPPAWPDTAMGPGRRERGRWEVYYLFLRTAREPRLHVDLSLWPERWAQFRAGQRVAYAPLDPRGGPLVIPIDSTRACRRWHAGRGRPPQKLGCSPRRS